MSSGYLWIENTTWSQKWGIKRLRHQMKWIFPRQRYELHGEKSEKEPCSAFLYIIGYVGRDIFNSFVRSGEERVKISTLFLKKFESHCKPKRNVTVERYKFNIRFRVQATEETIDQFVTALRLIAKDCEFKLLGDRETSIIAFEFDYECH